MGGYYKGNNKKGHGAGKGSGKGAKAPAEGPWWKFWQGNPANQANNASENSGKRPAASDSAESAKVPAGNDDWYEVLHEGRAVWVQGKPGKGDNGAQSCAASASGRGPSVGNPAKKKKLQQLAPAGAPAGGAARAKLSRAFTLQAATKKSGAKEGGPMDGGTGCGLAPRGVHANETTPAEGLRECKACGSAKRVKLSHLGPTAPRTFAEQLGHEAPKMAAIFVRGCESLAGFCALCFCACESLAGFKRRPNSRPRSVSRALPLPLSGGRSRPV
eukprot:g2064.t1